MSIQNQLNATQNNCVRQLRPIAQRLISELLDQF